MLHRLREWPLLVMEALKMMLMMIIIVSISIEGRQGIIIIACILLPCCLARERRSVRARRKKATGQLEPAQWPGPQCNKRALSLIALVQAYTFDRWCVRVRLARTRALT